MNKDRRKAIDKIVEKILECANELESLKDEEQEYFDNMPESLQSGEKATIAESAISSLEDALSDLDSAIQNAEQASE